MDQGTPPKRTFTVEELTAVDALANLAASNNRLSQVLLNFSADDHADRQEILAGIHSIAEASTQVAAALEFTLEEKFDLPVG